MMSFMGEARVKWVDEQFDAYRRRNRIAKACLLLAVPDVVFLAVFDSYLPPDIRLPAGQIGSVILLGLFLVGAILLNRELEYYLPTVEDRLLCFLKPALESLRAYGSYGKEHDKKKALKSLERAADILGEWDAGNLKFVEDGPIGKTLSVIQKNFRRGVLPAAKDTNKDKVRDILVVLANMENVLEQTNTIDNEHLEIWGKMLARYPPSEPPKPLWRKLPANKSHLSMGLLVLVVPLAIGLVGISLLHVSVEAAYLGGITTFGAMVGLLVYVLSRKKTS